MNDKLLDYHVGILRGYMLALNAPTQVLHALEVLLGDHRSKAGPIIGKSVDTQEGGEIKINAPMRTDITNEIVRAINPPESEKRAFTRWTKDEVNIIERGHGEGKTVAEITAMLSGRKYAQVYAKMTALELL